MLDAKAAALLADAKKNLSQVLDEEWPRITRCYDESMSEHESKADENSKKMVFTIPLSVRLCDTDGKTRADAKVTYGTSFSASAIGRVIDGHPELDLDEDEGADD